MKRNLQIIAILMSLIITPVVTYAISSASFKQALSLIAVDLGEIDTSMLAAVAQAQNIATSSVPVFDDAERGYSYENPLKTVATGIFSIKITAGGEDVLIDKNLVINTNIEKTSYVVDAPNPNARNSSSYFFIPAGNSQVIRINATLDNSTSEDGLKFYSISGIRYRLANGTAAYTHAIPSKLLTIRLFMNGKIKEGGVEISNTATSYSLVTKDSSVPYGAEVSYSFTLSNLTDDDKYISKIPSVTIATSAESLAGAVVSPAYPSIVSPVILPGDTRTFHIIPSGTSRVFIYNSLIDNAKGKAGTKKIKITSVKYFNAPAYLSPVSLKGGFDDLSASIALDVFRPLANQTNPSPSTPAVVQPRTPSPSVTVRPPSPSPTPTTTVTPRVSSSPAVTSTPLPTTTSTPSPSPTPTTSVSPSVSPGTTSGGGGSSPSSSPSPVVIPDESGAGAPGTSPASSPSSSSQPESSNAPSSSPQPSGSESPQARADDVGSYVSLADVLVGFKQVIKSVTTFGR